jgi:hypothetical protein
VAYLVRAAQSETMMAKEVGARSHPVSDSEAFQRPEFDTLNPYRHHREPGLVEIASVCRPAVPPLPLTLPVSLLNRPVCVRPSFHVVASQLRRAAAKTVFPVKFPLLQAPEAARSAVVVVEAVNLWMHADGGICEGVKWAGE